MTTLVRQDVSITLLAACLFALLILPEDVTWARYHLMLPSAAGAARPEQTGSLPDRQSAPSPDRPAKKRKGHNGSSTSATVAPGVAGSSPPGAAPPAAPATDIQALLAQLDSARFFRTIETLAGFGTRYTNSRQILKARDYIRTEFQTAGLPVEWHQFKVGTTTAYNVIATLTGTAHPDVWYIVCGHYDSISEIPTRSAPGAEDNGSGTAGVLELARVLAGHPQPATIKFIAFAGEEEGLLGSDAYIRSLASAGDIGKVKGVINMDMISYSADNDLDIVLETSAFAKPLLDTLVQAAAQFTTLRVATSFNPFGSDHVPFLKQGVQAILTIDGDWNSYPSYHQSTDVPARVTVQMGMQVLRMNLAGLVELISGSPSGGWWLCFIGP